MKNITPSIVLAALLLFTSSGAVLHAGTELLTNGGFGDGTSGWTLVHLHDAHASVAAEPVGGGQMAAHVVVAEATAEAFYVQLFQGKLNVEAGKTYRLRFRACSKPGAAIGVNLMLGESPWTSFSTREVTLTPEWQDFSFDLVVSQAAANARVTFSRLGAQPCEYWFTNVSLIMVN
ncbi:MAG: carbohydrate binding domain-containing protein [Chthoniobacteraceae bacterium]